MKRKLLFISTGIITTVIMISSCATTSEITEKIGAQLWGENCNRCHNAPSPTDFSDTQWETIGAHMKIRANLTDEETKKIIEFLQSAN